MATVLLLNADAQPLSLMPLSTISWQNAIKAYFQDKVKIIKNYEDYQIRSQNLTIHMPSIVMLTRFHRLPKRAKFSRRNLYVRDDFKCQYCGNKFSQDKLTIDHVIPRSKGGKINWSNCVSACTPCNSRKGSKLITPIKPPRAPSYYEINNKARDYYLEIPDMSWLDYLNWPVELISIKK